MSTSNFSFGARARAIAQSAKKAVLNAPLEPIISPSKLRIQIVGIIILVGQPLYYIIWTVVIPEPYENLGLRVCMMLFGALLVLPVVCGRPFSRTAARVFSLATFANLPFFFWWMYFANGGDAAWLASVTAMIFFYYYVTDWRLASAGVAAGLLINVFLWSQFSSSTAVWQALAATWPVHLFSWVSGVVLGLSAANTRRQRLLSMLSTMAIMAHELRTPLATLSLIGQALNQRLAGLLQAKDATAAAFSGLAVMQPQVEKIAQLVRLMNHQIDTQISNSSLLVATGASESVSMGQVVHGAITSYPFTDAALAQCVEVEIASDFTFRGSRLMTSQVITNLLKNALRALVATQRDPVLGDVSVTVTASGASGKLIFADRGVGMPLAVRERVFEPFFTTHESSGHGLGLMFCKQVIQRAGGIITLESQEGAGTQFTVTLPIERSEAREHLHA
jgi:two-component system, CAI-1 autoinducer sensor kinase/phosphatase CqsS